MTEKDPHAAEREALRGLQHAFEQAVSANRLEDFAPHVASDFSIVTFTDRSFKNFASFTERWKQTRQELVGAGSFRTEMKPDPSLFFGDIAVCSGESSNTMVDKRGKSFDFTSHWTAVMHKEQGQWKVVRGHNSLDPFGNPMLKSSVQRLLIQSTVTALLIGIALGWLVGKWLK